MSIAEFAEQLNAWGAARVPFLFVVDFELKRPLAFPLHEVDPSVMRYFINGLANYSERENGSAPVVMKKFPETLADYRNRFRRVADRLAYGDTFLTNLTIRTPVQLDRSLLDLFRVSTAKYKLWYDDQFLVFSPETFIQIREGRIFSYPMKGTIDADTPEAARVILADRKEEAEHVTIGDLIRNDLSQVAMNVRVNRYRYVDQINTNTKKLLQVSSEISGELPPDYRNSLGSLLVSLLPAGSVSGAPKPKTLRVISEAEGQERGYFTGVFGYFDGENLDSGVMIRFIEKSGSTYYYRSGGGITTQSSVESEYQEAIDKIYVPVG